MSVGRPGTATAACLAWCALAPLSVGLSLAAPRGILRDSGAGGWARLTLASAELAALGALVFLLALGFRAFSRLRLAGRVLRCAALALLLFAYAASWGMFWTMGRFLDGEGLAFLAYDLRSVMGYAAGMHAVPLVAAAVGSAVLAFAGGELLPRWVGGRPLPRFTRAAGAAAALCALLAAGGELAGSDKDYRFRRTHAAGPSLRLLSQLVEEPAGPEQATPPAQPPRVVYRPRLAEAPPPPAPRRMNVVLILVDSFRADHLGTGVMPSLDALAARSRLFTDCLTTATHTDYAAPSALSSHYPLRSAGTHRYPDHPTYPRVLLWDVLKPLGYRTALFSSQDEGWRRMDRYLRTEGLDHCFDANSIAIEGGLLRNPEGTLDDAITVSAAIRWIERGGAPFFASLNLQNAHPPYRVPPGFPRRFGPRERDFPLSFGWFPREKEPEVRGIYADSLSYIDAQLGRLFGHLEERGILEETVVAVTADHGEAFYEHGYAAHGGPVYDEVARVPLVLWVPGTAPGPDARPAQILDLPPTICRALGIPPHPAFQGLDLLEPGAPAERSRFIVAQTPTVRQYAVVRSGHKLVFDAQTRRYALYDLAGDPREERDVLEERPAVARELRELLAAWYEAQTGYYRDPALHRRCYPPLLEEPATRGASPRGAGDGDTGWPPRSR
jgi:arylsulfatase A-like enzyme